MKKIVFTLVALAGLLSASEYLQISNNVVMVSQNSNIVSVFKLGDIAYTTRSANQNIIVLKQPANAIITVENNVNHNDISKAFANYLAAQK
ncbi:MAG: hypothetical protein KU29_09630 [Sulfurovum sp. FS06-10]|nr:MAG: hypothetical protein KU29_09630 [Sulfurovum sp. FS06-10]